MPPKPMLLATHEEPFDSENYIFEIKWDGFRCLAQKTAGQVRLWSRRGRDLTGRFPEIAAALTALPGDCLLDGELTVLRQEGDDFLTVARRARLQAAGRIAAAARTSPAVYIVFDILSCDGRDVTAEPLWARKNLLAARVAPAARVALNPWVPGRGCALFAVATARGYEGIVAKKTDSPYIPGVRSTNWLKIKRWREMAVPIIGYKTGRDFALVVAPADGAATIVRAGLSAVEESAFLPVATPLTTHMVGGIRYIEPVLQCVVKYKEFTAQGRLRHVRFVRFCLVRS